MSTKLTAARLATSAGVTTIITHSSTPSNIFHIVRYIQSLKTESSTGTPTIYHTSPTILPVVSTDNPIITPLTAATKLITRPSTPATPNLSNPAPPLHTRFLPKPRALRDRYFWILHGLAPHGTVYIDEGAYRALTRTDKAGLLPVGVVDVTGSFAQQDAVSLVVVKRLPEGGYQVMGKEVGRALVNYSSTEIARIKGEKSSAIIEKLGYADGEYVAYRDNTAFFGKEGKEMEGH